MEHSGIHHGMERPRNSDVVGGSTSGCRSSSRKRGKFLDAPVVTRHGRVEFLRV